MAALALQEYRGQLTLELVPGQRVGPFILGAPVGHLVQLLQTAPRLVPKVDFKYPAEEPLATDWVLGLTHALPPSPPPSVTSPAVTIGPDSYVEADTECPVAPHSAASSSSLSVSSAGSTAGPGGVSLLLDPVTQRLKLVVIHDLARLRLTYRGMECQSTKTVATGLLINRLFGPTHPGHFDATTGTFTLTYPGITFAFAIPERHRTQFARGGANLPLEFPDGTTPPCSTVYVYHGTDWREAAPPAPLIYTGQYRAMTGVSPLTFLTRCNATPGRGATLVLTDVGAGTRAAEGVERRVQLTLHATTAQDLVADLGQPQSVFTKHDDKMSIHAPAAEPAANPSPSTSSPVSDGETDPTAAAPPPTEQVGPDEEPSPLARDYFFNYYELGLDVLLDGASHLCKKVVLHANVPGHYDFGRYRKCPYRLLNREDVCGTAGVFDVDTKWTALHEVFNRDAAPPVVFNRGPSEQNPFGSTLFYGGAGVIFEVMRNDCVATVTIF
ncbi:hypothetical protein IWQ60_005508 [Tieghemiomyces parasiticus]|uniref:Uncharacterized protein n=1 Tax=Tieghemiomyces parasiticus TaxID=78921 RepID=A0A9W8A658_9FUNG|nr:hypothetical protein IWQ60_005508 [Tieghemiomyces parasiticus]